MYHALQEYKMFIAASNNIKNWAENYIKQGKAIKLNQMQLEINKTITEYNIVPVVKSRQSGGTLFGCLSTLHYAIFNNNVTVGINSFNYSMSESILKEIIDLYSSIDDIYKPKLEYMSKDKVRFENGSEIRIITESNIKGITFNMVYIDEGAYNPNWDTLYNLLVPVLTNTSKVLLISSHNPEAVSYNYFIKSMSKNSKLLVFPWYKSDIDPYKIKEIRNMMTFNSFVNEYECGGDYFGL